MEEAERKPATNREIANERLDAAMTASATETATGMVSVRAEAGTMSRHHLHLKVQIPEVAECRERWIRIGVVVLQVMAGTETCVPEGGEVKEVEEGMSTIEAGRAMAEIGSVAAVLEMKGPART